MEFSSVLSMRKRSQKLSTKPNINLDKDLIDNNSCLSSTESEKPQEVYFVQSILCEKVTKGQKFYKVRWQGFPPEADSWEPEENLLNVLHLIEDFQCRVNVSNQKSEKCQKDSLVFHNSLASVSSPVRSSCSLFSVDGIQSTGEVKQTNGYLKRKFCSKTRIGGRFEYVLKHELVASKTKYFDDVRDGKIDLSSNDLYSRVKTRRRCAAETASNSTSNDSMNSRNGSLQEEVDQDCDNLMENFTQYFPKLELSPPLSGCFYAVDSVKDSNCAYKLDNDNVPELVDAFSIDKVESHASLNVNILPNMDTSQNLKSVDKKLVMNSKSIQTDEFLIDSDYIQSNFDSKRPCKDVALSPLDFDQTNGLNTFDLKGKNQTLIVPNSKFTVPSVHQLLNSYFKLVLSHWSNNNVSFNCNATNQTNGMDQSKHAIDLSIESDLAELPQLCLFRPDVHIRTNEEMLDAISNHRWNLLALSDFVLSHNFKNEISQSKTFVEQALLACIVQGAGRPLVVLHRLIQSGLDLNSVFDPQTRCSIIVLAVRLGQHHAVQAFLDAGCRPNSIESRITQRTILGMAIAAGDVDMTNILVLGGANFYEVEPGITALNLIIRLLNNNLSSAPKLGCSKEISTIGQSSSIFHKPSHSNGFSQSKSGFLRSLALIEFQDKLCSLDSQYPPIPCPLSNTFNEFFSLPKAVIYNALMDNCYSYIDSKPTSSTTAITTSTTTTDCSQSKLSNHTNDDLVIRISLPSVDSLRRIYELIAAHHARLSTSVSSLVRNWLLKANLTQIGLLSSCQWININERVTSIQFHWPMSVDKFKTDYSVHPILVLVHGQITPPACYDLWMDDEGPCFIKQVLLDQIYVQKPLNRASFVTTLYPLDAPGSCVMKEHQVSIEFDTKSKYFTLGSRPICVATMIIAVQNNQRNPV